MPPFAENVRTIASELAELLEAAARQEDRRYAHLAALARDLSSAAADKPEQIVDHYCTVNWWGGSGSMADLDISDGKLRRRHTELLVALVKLCRDAGIDCPRAECWSASFESWLERNAI